MSAETRPDVADILRRHAEKTGQRFTPVFQATVETRTVFRGELFDAKTGKIIPTTPSNSARENANSITR